MLRKSSRQTFVAAQLAGSKGATHSPSAQNGNIFLPQSYTLDA